MKTVLRQNSLTIAKEQREKLAGILSIEPNGNAMKQTEAAIIRAYALADIPSTSTDLTELKANLKSLQSSLKKIHNSFGKIQHTLRFMDNAHFIDDHYCVVNNGDTYLMELSQIQGKGSGFGIVIDRLQNAVQNFENESCVTPGKGKNKDTRFTNALVTLADFFVANFPEKKLSENKGTVFANFAGWFLDLHPGVTAPRRHIGNALEARASRSTPPK